ncbi:hypothetical protein D3C86_1169150 [compost metagenome]
MGRGLHTVEQQRMLWGQQTAGVGGQRHRGLQAFGECGQDLTGPACATTGENQRTLGVVDQGHGVIDGFRRRGWRGRQ